MWLGLGLGFDVNYLAVPQRARVWDAVADDLIDGGAARLGEAAVVERRRVRTWLGLGQGLKFRLRLRLRLSLRLTLRPRLRLRLRVERRWVRTARHRLPVHYGVDLIRGEPRPRSSDQPGG